MNVPGLMQKPIIKGYYGCYCHPFDTWDECEKEHNKILKVGQKVKHRCTDREGIVIEIYKDNRKWVHVKYGKCQCDIHCHNVGELILIS